MSDELRKNIRWDRPCYKCLSNYCDLSCPDLTKPVATPDGMKPERCGTNQCSCIECVAPSDAVDWEAIAADQAMTIAMMKVDYQRLYDLCASQEIRLMEQEEWQKEAERYVWALPILTGVDSEKADSRALAIAFQLMRGLDGGAAIDAAMQEEQSHE